MKKSTLYVVIKYNDRGEEIETKTYPIHTTNLYELDCLFSSTEYDIYYGRHNKRGGIILFDKIC